MIEKLLLDHDPEEQLIALTEKLNEVSAIVNGLTGQKSSILSDQLLKAAKKAATTGNRTDLHEYLKLRRLHG